MRVFAVFLLFVPLVGCLGWGDMFAPKRPIAGDYFLMEGDENTTKDLYLLVRHHSTSVAGRLHRIGWNQQYIIYTDDNNPTEWNVVVVKEHTRFTITDIQRTQDSRFKQIAIGSASEAWQWAKNRKLNSNAAESSNPG
jgi:hypothetical protein